MAYEIISPSFVPSLDLAIDSSYFSVDFLPDGPKHWSIYDNRGSLLLVSNPIYRDPTVFPHILAVCEPLTRGYMRIPAPPNLDESTAKVYKCYLVDGDADDAGRRIGMSNFRVFCEIHRGGITHAAVFTVAGDVGSWSEKAIDKIVPRLHHKRLFGHAGGSWYYVIGDMTVVAFDGHAGEYLPLQLPSNNEDWPRHVWNSPLYILDGRDGKPCIFSTEDNILKVFARLGSSDSWVLVKKVSLQEATRGLPGYKSVYFRYPLHFWGSRPGLVVLTPIGRELWLFSVDLDTMEVSTMSAQDELIMMFRYELPWPPVLRNPIDPTPTDG